MYSALFLYLAAIALEVLVFTGIVVAAPFFLAKRGGARWALRTSAALLWLLIFHGKEVIGHALIAFAKPPANVVSCDAAFCEGMNLIDLGRTPVTYGGADAVEGHVWQFHPPLRFIDTVGECGPRCATWLRSGFVERIYVGTPDAIRVPYSSDTLPRLRAVSIVSAPRCDAMIEGTLSQRSLGDYLNGRVRPARELPAWDSACFAYEETDVAQPVILSLHTIEVSDIGLGLSRIEFTTALLEHSSGRVLADTHMTMIRGVRPTFQPLATVQHVSRGALADSYELMRRYRSTNCGSELKG